MTPYKQPLLQKMLSKGMIDRAGQAMIDFDYSQPANEEVSQAFSLISDRRALHMYPLNTFQANLRVCVKRMGIEKETIIAQRMKRIVSIISKLRRFSQTKLSRMQDIGGIRAIVPDTTSVTLLTNYYQNLHARRYKLIRQKNYIDEPKNDGYRSVHLVFEYLSTRYPQAHGLCFEFQVRTFVQHARATAVETIGTFIGESLKSHQGPQQRLDYFRLVSAGFSYMEGTKIDPFFSDLSPKQIISQIISQTQQLKVEETISGFSLAAKEIKQITKRTHTHHKDLANNFSLFIITLDTKKRIGFIKGFTSQKKEKAVTYYKEQEQKTLVGDSFATVLVSMKQIKNLERAYPSFFGDNKLFLELLKKLEVMI